MLFLFYAVYIRQLTKHSTPYRIIKTLQFSLHEGLVVHELFFVRIKQCWPELSALWTLSDNMEFLYFIHADDLLDIVCQNIEM